MWRYPATEYAQLQELQITIELEIEGIPLGKICPAHICIHGQLGMDIHADTGLKMLRVDKIHADVACLPRCT